MERLDSMWESTDEEVMELIDSLIMEEGRRLGLNLRQKSELRRELFCSVRKLDVLQELLEDSGITEIMVNGWQHIFVEKNGRIFPWEKHFTSPEKIRPFFSTKMCCHPIVDARLDNGSRVNAVIAPAALDGPVLTIRQFPEEPVTMERLLAYGSVTEETLRLLIPLVRAKYTILIGGGTGAGKTTMLNALSAFIPEDERIITIEDNAELQIQGIPNLVRLECRAANIEASQEITMADLLKTALRMRPDRIIVGEVRSDAEELLQAVNVGAEGSMSTIHANSCRDMITRLETLVLMGINLPLPAIRRQIAAGFDIFVHLGRLRDKSRRLLEICEIDGIVEDEVVLNPLFLYEEECGLVQKGKLKHRGKLERAGITLEDGL